MHTFRVHHNCKIDTARFEEGKRPSPSRLATKRSRDALTPRALMNQDGKKFLCGRKTKPTAAKPNHWFVRPHRRSVKGLATARLVLDRHTEQDDADNRDGDPVQDQPSRDRCSVHDKGSSFGRANVADIFLHVHNQVVELVAGTEGERLFLSGEPWFAADDERQAVA